MRAPQHPTARAGIGGGAPQRRGRHALTARAESDQPHRARSPKRARGEIVANSSKLRRFSNQPVAEIVQCGEPNPQSLQ
jgi:hypothetical protein